MGNIVAGRLSDRFGRRAMDAAFTFIAPILTIWVYSAHSFSIAPAWTLELVFDTGGGTILRSFCLELFPTSYRSTAGSALQVAGATGGAPGLALEVMVYGLAGSHFSSRPPGANWRRSLSKTREDLIGYFRKRT
jgi:MFS family permease